MIPFENTPENAREILSNLGQNIDIVAGIFDECYFNMKHCTGFEICRVPICCAVSLNHPLAQKDKLTVEDLYGENLMLIHRGWSSYVDRLRDEIWANHPQIHIVDFHFYNVGVFNQCQNSNDILMAVDAWSGVHPLLKILPVMWDYSIPYGILHSDNPSENVKKLLSALKTITKNKL